MRHGHQEDAEEFLGFFLNTLHEEVLALLARQPASEREKVVGRGGGKTEEGVKVAGQREDGEPAAAASGSGGGDGWMEVGKKNKANLLKTVRFFLIVFPLSRRAFCGVSNGNADFLPLFCFSCPPLSSSRPNRAPPL
jgi:hypothetical protein